MAQQTELLTAPAAAEVSPRTLPRIVWVAAFLGSLVVVYYQTRRVFLFSDDFVFLGQARDADLSVEYLRTGLFQHFSPLSRLAHYLAVDQLPEHPGLVLWVVMTLWAILALGCILLIRSLLGDRWLAVWASVLLMTSLSLLPLTNWWTAAINIMPGLAGITFAFAGIVRLTRGGSPLWGGVTILGYTVAVLDYELLMILPAYFLLWVVLFHRRVSSSSLRSILLRTWWVWSALLVIGIASLANFALVYYVPGPKGSLSDVVTGMYLSLVETLLPSFLGVHDPSRRGFTVAGTVVAALIFVATVAWTVSRSRRAWRGWLFALAGWSLPSAALVISRVGYFGPEVGRQLVYYFLPTLLFTIGALEAIVAKSRDGAAPTIHDADQQPVRDRPTHRALIAVAAAVGVVVVLNYAASAGPAVRWRPLADASRSYVTNVEADLDALGDDRSSVSILDTNVPEAVVPAMFWPFNQASRALPILLGDLDFDSPDLPLYRLGADGRLSAESYAPTVELGLERPGSGGSEANVTNATDVSTDPAGGVCFTTSGESTTVGSALSQPVPGERLVIRSRFEVSDPVGVRMTVAPAVGDLLVPVDGQLKTWLPSREGTLDTVATSDVGLVVLQFTTSDVRVCVSSISIGTVGPS